MMVFVVLVNGECMLPLGAGVFCPVDLTGPAGEV